MINKNTIDRYDLLMNPAFGSIALSSFSKGYCSKEEGVPFILCFFIIPLVFQKDIRETILSSKNFSKFVSNLNKNHNDRLAMIHKNIKNLRYLTMKSLLISSSARLLKINYKNGLIIGNISFTLPQDYKDNKLLQEVYNAANKLGVFFSQTQIRQVFQKLKVEA